MIAVNYELTEKLPGKIEKLRQKFIWNLFVLTSSSEYADRVHFVKNYNKKNCQSALISWGESISTNVKLANEIKN